MWSELFQGETAQMCFEHENRAPQMSRHSCENARGHRSRDMSCDHETCLVMTRLDMSGDHETCLVIARHSL